MKQSPSCFYCESLDEHQAELFQTDYWQVGLMGNQAYLGRSHVTAKRHVGHIRDLSSAEWKDLGEVMKRFEDVATKAFGTTHFNWTSLMNDAYKAEEPNPHVHWHAWPRYKDPVRIDDTMFEDPNFAHHYDKSASRAVDKATLDQIREQFLGHLN